MNEIGEELQQAILEIASTLEKCPITNRALALLIADCSNVTLTRAQSVLETIPELSKIYLKAEKK